MRVITKQTLANGALDRWNKQYEIVSYEHVPFVRARLEALGPTPTPEAVNEAIGNDGWTRIRCDECNESVNAVVELGQEPDYESSTACICLECLKKAIALSEVTQ